MVALRPSEIMAHCPDGYYVLDLSIDDVSIEGTATEWLAIATAIRERNKATFSHCAVCCWPAHVELLSPAYAESSVSLTFAEADHFAEHVIAFLSPKPAGEDREADVHEFSPATRASLPDLARREAAHVVIALPDQGTHPLWLEVQALTKDRDRWQEQFATCRASLIASAGREEEMKVALRDIRERINALERRLIFRR